MDDIVVGLGEITWVMRGSREAKRKKLLLDHVISNPIASEGKGGEDGRKTDGESETMGCGARV